MLSLAFTSTVLGNTLEHGRLVLVTEFWLKNCCFQDFTQLRRDLHWATALAAQTPGPLQSFHAMQSFGVVLSVDMNSRLNLPDAPLRQGSSPERCHHGCRSW